MLPWQGPHPFPGLGVPLVCPSWLGCVQGMASMSRCVQGRPASERPGCGSLATALLQVRFCFICL